ncbi:hypothetical protein VNO77_27289 [Canavalia gladiata]|uniref:Uncharacterized protein n=1 Tax=Canavalia gladiata TaxID=3824 RepID=A0AAN9KWP2_CANGL
MRWRKFARPNLQAILLHPLLWGPKDTTLLSNHDTSPWLSSFTGIFALAYMVGFMVIGPHKYLYEKAQKLGAIKTGLTQPDQSLNGANLKPKPLSVSRPYSSYSDVASRRPLLSLYESTIDLVTYHRSAYSIICRIQEVRTPLILLDIKNEFLAHGSTCCSRPLHNLDLVSLASFKPHSPQKIVFYGFLALGVRNPVGESKEFLKIELDPNSKVGTEMIGTEDKRTSTNKASTPSFLSFATLLPSLVFAASPFSSISIPLFLAYVVTTLDMAPLIKRDAKFLQFKLKEWNQHSEPPYQELWGCLSEITTALAFEFQEILCIPRAKSSSLLFLLTSETSKTITKSREPAKFFLLLPSPLFFSDFLKKKIFHSPFPTVN